MPPADPAAPQVPVRTLEHLIDNLRADARRGVYRTRDGDLQIDYGGGGPVAEAIVQNAARDRILRLKWPDRPDLEYWVLA